jgi:hypothetical protein
MRLNARARARRTHVIFPILLCDRLWQPHKMKERERENDGNDITKKMTRGLYL